MILRLLVCALGVLGLCGNQLLELSATENCDPPDGFGCINCRRQPGYTCTNVPHPTLKGRYRTVCRTICGDGYKTASDACDDGNMNNGDGCSRTCTVEPGFDCTTDLARRTHCAIVSGGEADIRECFGETAACMGNRVVKGWYCSNDLLTQKSTCQTLCNDNIWAYSEQCDNDPHNAQDGCLNCLLSGSINTDWENCDAYFSDGGQDPYLPPNSPPAVLPSCTCPSDSIICSSGTYNHQCVKLDENQYCGTCNGYHNCVADYHYDVPTCCQTSTAQGYCADLFWDINNCASCYHVCSAGVTPACCRSACKDLFYDNNNCGSCDTVCTGVNPSCCSGHCKDLSSDASNCNSCGNVCSTGHCCGGSCVDFNTDNANCGSCGHTCTGSDSCSGGTCVSPCAGCCTTAADCILSGYNACALGKCINDGVLRFTITWDLAGDVDLIVKTPNALIYYSAKIADGGKLDQDDTTGTGPENTLWTGAPPAGTYYFCANAYNIHGTTNVTPQTSAPSNSNLPDVRNWPTKTLTTTIGVDGNYCSESHPGFITTLVIN